MELLVNFPSDASVISEEVARFRALSEDDQVHALGECFRDYHFLAAASGRPAELYQFALDEEHRSQAAIREFFSRHG